MRHFRARGPLMGPKPQLTINTLTETSSMIQPNTSDSNVRTTGTSKPKLDRSEQVQVPTVSQVTSWLNESQEPRFWHANAVAVVVDVRGSHPQFSDPRGSGRPAVDRSCQQNLWKDPDRYKSNQLSNLHPSTQ